jgi:dihydroorotate dehydrogenase electron transfer subunit
MKSRQPLQVKAALARRVSVGPESFLFTLDVPGGFPTPEPGQFVHVTAAPELVLRRPFSVAAFRGEKHLELLVELRGPGTRGFAALPDGAEVDILGPLGNSFTFPEESETAVLVAGGIGVAGLRFLAERLLVEAHRTLALVGDRSRDRLLDHLLPEPAGGGRYRIEVATDDGGRGFEGPITGLLESEIGKLKGDARLYCCGPPPMIHEVARIAESASLPCEALMEEIMACGVGACRGCVVKTRSGYRSACSDGPVFDTSDLVFEEATDA